MNDFKQWRDEENIFHIQTMVYFGDCNRKGELGIDKLLRLTSDLAVEEFNEKGLSREHLLENGFAILVSRLSFRFHNIPKENQRITVSTWEEKTEPLQFIRQYEITDSATGEKLVTGLSTWLLVDPVARRIMPTKKFTLRPEPTLNKGHDCMNPGKILSPENPVNIEERTIRYSDLDSNGHTTNSRYAAFIMDALPEKYAEKHFTDFRINFSKEVFLGHKVTILADFNDADKKITVTGKTEEGLSFESELYYDD